jgi:Ca-activated chloride channel family protein
MITIFRIIFLIPLVLLLLLHWSKVASGQKYQESITRVLFILDGSESMADRWQSDSKFNIAVNILSALLDSLQTDSNLEIGLRLYGQNPIPGQECEDSRVVIPFGHGQTGAIKKLLKSLYPKGTTPIAYSLYQTIEDFKSTGNPYRNVVILLTDGLEACGGDPCKASVELQKQGIFLRPFIVGIGRNMQAQFQCMGIYFDATVEKMFKEAVNSIVATSLKKATVQVNLLDEQGMPSESDVYVRFTNRITGHTVLSFIHNIEHFGKPDTIEVDPLVPYDILVQTIPPMKKDSVWIEPGKHTEISFNAAQGFIRINHASGSPLDCIIRQHGKGEAIHVQKTGSIEKYLCDHYDVTVLTLPRMNFNDVVVYPGKTTILDIPETIQCIIESDGLVSGSLFLRQGDELFWVSHLQSDSLNNEFSLQPGAYRIIYRKQGVSSVTGTRQKDFTVESGTMTHILID